MFNQLSKLTAGLCATGGLMESVTPFDVAECLSNLLILLLLTKLLKTIHLLMR